MWMFDIEKRIRNFFLIERVFFDDLLKNRGIIMIFFKKLYLFLIFIMIY